MAENLNAELKNLIVSRLKLEMAPADIDDAAPLFGEGLGLDSIDALELVVGIERLYGIRIADAEVGKKAFASVNALAEFVREKRAAKPA
jgi:acyl carrier protein